MTPLPADATLRTRILTALRACDLFRAMDAQLLSQLQERVTALALDEGEELVAEGSPSDSFFLVLDGALDVRRGDTLLATLRTGDAAGEMGLLLEEPRSATLTARGATRVLRFAANDFRHMVERAPGFGGGISRALALRLRDANLRVPLPEWDETQAPDPSAVTTLPASFRRRHGVLPLAVRGEDLVLGCVQDPTPEVLAAVQAHHPSLTLHPVRIPARLWEAHHPVEPGAPGGEAAREANEPATVSLDSLLRRMVAEGASDLHLSAGHRPWWRQAGELRVLADEPLLGADTVAELLEPVMDARAHEAWLREHDVDFAHAIAGVARFRVNLFRDHRGASAVLRQIPSTILSFEQLGLPPAIGRLCEHPKGLVLVTGPTGSGKSTTLAAMIDAINRTRPVHILTMEDPIEFVHTSQKALVNQREVGTHTASFTRALKAALREDPDVVLVGELRDRETVQLALETANTGHLVFATLHTNTAASTVDRIVDLFPADQHGAVRASLGETLRGVVCQTLCRRIGGGRVAALEVLVSTPAVANLVREGKSFQLTTVMQTGKSVGMQLLNDELARLVQERKVDLDEALSKAADKTDLAKRFGRTG